jgi:hypothetical protein
VHTAEQADLETVSVGPADLLGSEGVHRVTLEVVSRASGGIGWVYAKGGAEVEVPPPTTDIEGVEAALADRGATEYESKSSPGFLGKLSRSLFGGSVLADAQHQLDNIPARVKKAATILARGLATPPAKADGVARLLRRRQHTDSTVRPRSLVQIADSPELTNFEGGLLATALLRCMGVEAQLYRATIDGQDSALCAWRHVDRLYGLPIWPAENVVLHGVRVEAWTDDTNPSPPPSVGWEVVGLYETIATRQLPFALAETQAVRDGRNADPAPPASVRSSPRPIQPAPTCPACDAPMRRRKGRYGDFWGCSRYPSCRGTRQG